MSWSSKPEPTVPPLALREYSALDSITDSVITEIANRLLIQYSAPNGQLIALSPQEFRIALQMGRGVLLKDIAKELGLRHPSDLQRRIRNCCRRHGINRHQLQVYGAFLALRKGDL